ncbi:MAG: hypothetical protein ACRBC3_07305 [Burkholderiaceae bacterium]
MERETHFAEQEVTEIRERLTRRIGKISAQLTPVGLVSAVVAQMQESPKRNAAAADRPDSLAGTAESDAQSEHTQVSRGLKNWVVENPVAAGLATMAVGALVASIVLSKNRSAVDESAGRQSSASGGGKPDETPGSVSDAQ